MNIKNTVSTIHRDRQRERHTHTDTDTDRQIERQRETETDRDRTDGEINRDRVRGQRQSVRNGWSGNAKDAQPSRG